MAKKLPILCALVLTLPTLPAARGLAQQPAPRFLDLPADTVDDKIRGGMLAQIIGNLNGLPHEFKYIDQPGNVKSFTPSLPNGAVTDDDTDIEWVYLREIARTGNNTLPPDQIASLWKRHINRRIFAANRYARDLMDLDLEPPWTGNVTLNPWSDFNISGQFICESFGLMAPAMPQTAARLGLNYTHVAIDGEPAQATQLFTTMIATAFIETDIDRILDAGLKAVDPKSKIAEVVTSVRQLCRDNPTDWRNTRLAIKNRWQTHGGAVRDRNGYELNTACVIAAFLYGHGDFIETLRTAFNFGWDADCNAATAATIVGVMKGYRWMNEQGWDIQDIYRNHTRDDMPAVVSLSSLENICIDAARVTIKHNGGEIVLKPSPLGRGQGEGASNTSTLPPPKLYRIPIEQPANIEPLATRDDRRTRVVKHFESQLAKDLSTPGIARARAAYITICLGKIDETKRNSPDDWAAAVIELKKHAKVVHNLFKSPAPIGDPLRQAAEQAGLEDPKNLKLTERPLE